MQHQGTSKGENTVKSKEDNQRTPLSCNPSQEKSLWESHSCFSRRIILATLRAWCCLCVCVCVSVCVSALAWAAAYASLSGCNTEAVGGTFGRAASHFCIGLCAQPWSHAWNICNCHGKTPGLYKDKIPPSSRGIGPRCCSPTSWWLQAEPAPQVV